MDIACYEHDQGFVLQRFREGQFDYIDAASETVETDFFRFIQAHRYLQSLAQTYPSPREKEEVPTWFYIASNLSMRLHGVHSFHAFPYVVRCGGMLNAFGPQIAHKAHHPETGDVTLSCQGFNDKNEYDRQTPCDQDFLRKFSKDTDPTELERWFNRDVARLLKKHRAFDPEGIFIGDGSYVFVPDNDKYEGSVRMLFDEHGHPVDHRKLETVSPRTAACWKWRRCYKLVSLLHTDRARSFCLRVALRLIPGNAHECPVFYDMFDAFVADVGLGVVRRLILDRGFLDGERIARCKKQLGVDVLIPLRKNMDLYEDALGLLKLPEVPFQLYKPQPRPRVDPPRLPDAPPRIQKREQARQETLKERKAEEPPPPADKTIVKNEVAGIVGFRSWQSCPLPLSLIINRETYGDGHQEIWMLLDTKPVSTRRDPARRRDEYAIRTEIEEGHRQLKCFWDLAHFTARRFSLVLNQVVFVILAYNLLHLYLRKLPRQDLQRRTRPRVQRQLLPSDTVIIIYCENRFAMLSPLAYTELLLTLSEPARKKILQKTRLLQRELTEELHNPRPP